MSWFNSSLTFDAGVGNTITLTGSAAGNGFTSGSETSTGDFTSPTAITQIDIVGAASTTLAINSSSNNIALPAFTIESTVGEVSLNAAIINTTGSAQTYDAPVVLNTDVNLTGTTVTFGSTVNDGNAPGTDSLTVTGAAVFDGEFGGNVATQALHVTLGATINTAVISTTGTQAFDGPASLNASATLSGSTITFGSTVDDGNAPGTDILNIPGNAVFNGLVGGSAALQSVTVGGAASIDSTGITTTGTQLYTGQKVTIGGNDLNGTTVTFNDTIDDSALDTHNLTIGGNAVFDGSVGETTPLGSLTVNGTTAINTTEINTFLGGGDGEQVYKGNVTLETTDFTIFLDATAVLFFDNLTLGATASTATDALSVPESEIAGGQLTSTLTGNGQVGFISAAEADMTVGSPNVNLVYSNFFSGLQRPVRPGSDNRYPRLSPMLQAARRPSTALATT